MRKPQRPKLPRETVEAIRAEAGFTRNEDGSITLANKYHGIQRDLADKYGTSRAVVNIILKGLYHRYGEPVPPYVPREPKKFPLKLRDDATHKRQREAIKRRTKQKKGTNK